VRLDLLWKASKTIYSSLDYEPFSDSTFAVLVRQTAAERLSYGLAGKVFRGNQFETDSLSSFFRINHLGQDRIKLIQRRRLIFRGPFFLHGNHEEIGGRDARLGLR
jgi:hypothetical protein